MRTLEGARTRKQMKKNKGRKGKPTPVCETAVKRRMKDGQKGFVCLVPWALYQIYWENKKRMLLSKRVGQRNQLDSHFAHAVKDSSCSGQAESSCTAGQTRCWQWLCPSSAALRERSDPISFPWCCTLRVTRHLEKHNTFHCLSGSCAEKIDPS